MNPATLSNDQLTQAALKRAVGDETISIEDQLYAIHRLRTLLDTAERDAVKRGRNDGMTWAWIGEIFGVTRQAAHERFGGAND
ncbi:MAG: hypothetical protein WAN48_09875 [Actinomycetes bacterium]